MAEWLGSGLQNRVQRFDSARNLTNPFLSETGFLFSAGIEHVFADQHQQQGKRTAQEDAYQGIREFADAEDLQEEKVK